MPSGKPKAGESLADLLIADEFARFDFEGSALEPTLDLLLEQRRRALS